MRICELFHLTERSLESDRHRARAADHRYAPPRGLRRGARPAARPRLARHRRHRATGRPRSTATGRSSFACKARPRDEPDAGGAICAREGYRRARAGRRLRRPGARPGCRWSTKAALDRFAPQAAEPVGDAAAAEDRPHRLPVADPPLPRCRRRASCSSIPTEVPAVAKETGAIPFDIEGVEISHEGPRCSSTPCSSCSGWRTSRRSTRLALIVRGADTARPDLAPEAAGLHAISLGLSALAGDDDHGLLRHGFMVYDALFAYLRFAAQERHNWPAKAA